MTSKYQQTPLQDRQRFTPSYMVTFFEKCSTKVYSWTDNSILHSLAGIMEDADKLSGFATLTHGLHETSSGSTLSFYYTHASQTKSAEKIVLVLIHGWPQT